MHFRIPSPVILVAITIATSSMVGDCQAESPSSTKKTGFLDDPANFPIAVWLQDPARAPKYQDLGINLYVGLWKGPTEEQLAELKRHGMRVICSQNAVGLEHKDDPTIVAWMHGDEPDNAQSLGKGKGYGPPILPVENRRGLRAHQEGRSLAAGAAEPGPGRRLGQLHRPRRRAAIIPRTIPNTSRAATSPRSTSTRPVHEHKDVAGKLWFVADGVTRLRKWSDDQQAGLELHRMHPHQQPRQARRRRSR